MGKTRFKAIYIPENEEIFWRKFTEITKREGRGPSQVIRDFIKEYVKQHSAGNPQARMDTFIEMEFPALPTVPHKYTVEKWLLFNDKDLAEIEKSYQIALQRIHEARKIKTGGESRCSGCAAFYAANNWCRVVGKHVRDLDKCPAGRW